MRPIVLYRAIASQFKIYTIYVQCKVIIIIIFFLLFKLEKFQLFRFNSRVKSLLRAACFFFFLSELTNTDTEMDLSSHTVMNSQLRDRKCTARSHDQNQTIANGERKQDNLNKAEIKGGKKKQRKKKQ